MIRLMLAACVTAASLLYIEVARTATQLYCKHPTWRDFARLHREYPSFERALKRYFGAHWREAAIVSFGEGSWHYWARNGQYEGTFQMGYYERRTYGHSSTLEGQARAAARYFHRAGGWGPWQCRP